MAKPIGILGGTFDPIHHGHLRMAMECYERLALSEMRFIPLHTPPHRQQPFTSPEHRLAMLELAINNIEVLKIDQCELRRRKVSYTIDTVKLIRAKEGETPLCLLMGSDAFNTLPGWRDWQSLLDYVHIVIAERYGSREQPLDPALARLMDKYQTDNAENLNRQSAGKIFELHMPILDISATQIRDIFRRKNSPAFLLPDKVIDYIYSHNIYQTG